MAYTAQATVVAGQLMTAAFWNTYIRDNSTYLFNLSSADAQGTWVPLIGGSVSQSGQTYGSRVALYTRLGRMVHFSVFVQLTAKGSIAGDIQIQGLPYPAASAYYPCAMEWDALANAKVRVNGMIYAGASCITISGIGAAAVGSRVNLAPADLTDNTVFFAAGSYTV